MNEWQVIKQIRHLIDLITWEESPAEKVFSRPLISVGSDERAHQRLRFPMAVVRPEQSTTDPEQDEESDLEIARFSIRVSALNKTDPTGEAALIGAHRSDGTSKGRGLLEVQVPLIRSIQLLQGDFGVQIISRAKGKITPAFVEEVGYICFRDYNFEMKVANEPYYHTATRLAATALGGGSAALTWRVPPDRFDRFRVQLRRAVGATAPATITSGTGVALAGDLSTTVTDSPGAGTYSYAIFAEYDETYDFDNSSPNSTDRVSAAETLTSFVVT